MVICVGNLVLFLFNGKKVEKVLGNLDFMVLIDFYFNEIIQYVDIILFLIGLFEYGYYDLVLNMVIVCNMAKYFFVFYKFMLDSCYDW